MKLSEPQVLSDYFAAANEGRVDDAVDCFAPDAQVHDEARDYVGAAEIRSWIEGTRKYEPYVDVISIKAINNAYVATGKVSGKFSGSPIQLQFSFTVKDHKITSLEIQ